LGVMSKSAYADRDTVGTLSLKAREVQEKIIVGDLANELIKSLVDDLNELIDSKPYGDDEFYIIVHEKKDAQLTNVIRRRLCHTTKRPFPELNTTVFRHDPKIYKTWHCWTLPSKVGLFQIGIEPGKFDEEMVRDCKAFQAEQNDRFGFFGKYPEYSPIPDFKDREMKKKINRKALIY
jgi:hypothetical protein